MTGQHKSPHPPFVKGGRGGILSIVVLIVFASPLAGGAEEPAQEKISVCISCHRDMGGKIAEPVALWEKSFHSQMGNNCEGCHGGDPADEAHAMDPEKGFVGSPKPTEVASFCGKCHVGVKENYMKSVHYLTGPSGPTCTTCHHSHDVSKASFDLINETLCSQCHSYENGRKIKKSFISAEMALKEKEKGLTYLKRRGMPVKQLEEKLFALRNSLHQMTHTLDLTLIQEKTYRVLEDLGKMTSETELLRKRVHRRWWTGTGVACFLIVLILVLRALLKTYEEE